MGYAPGGWFATSVLMVVFLIRTGRVIGLSAARLAVIAATSLPQHHSAPQITRQFSQFLGQRHGLVEIGQKVAEAGALCHWSSSRCKAGLCAFKKGEARYLSYHPCR